METRMGKLASGLVVVLLSAGLGGCQLLGSEKSSEANDSAATASKAIPVQNVEPEEIDAEKVPNTVKVVAATPLTRPTDPDVRVKAIKKGRSNPFAELVAPAAKKAQPLEVKASNTSNSRPFGTRPALGNKTTQKSTIAKAPTPRPVAPQPTKSNELPRLNNPAASASSSTNEIVLPALPEPTLAKQVSVQGVMMLGGEPKAIVKAPNENVARTVQAGDFLANGQILVASIDMSNPQNPTIVLKESGQTVTVGVGAQPETVAAALPF